ncbi:MAG TPA: hypothetical protein VFB22_08190 [Candidatus Baltobacteraceae bacterium]|nr:hypothetical protein [Candidatus Baltobacteraceae bacterium]
MRRPAFAALVAASLVAPLALAGCGGSAPPAPAYAALPAAQTRAPAETAMGLPGETAMGLPGETAMGMPGGAFACTGLPATGAAACTITLALNVKADANPNAPADLLAGLHPADLRAAYGFPSANAGGTVAIVDAYDAPTVEADLAVYRAAFGLGLCTSLNGCFSKLNESGAAGPYPAPNTAWAQETALDVEMVSAVCPRCSIVLVEARSAALTDLAAAVDTAAKLRPKAISNSYYTLEWPGETALDAHYDHPGIAVTASSGDRGYAAYPATSPYVTAVGGTSLTREASGWKETGWEYTGHGCSADEPLPSFQSFLRALCPKRASVDVALVADPATGVTMFSTAAGGWVVAGGTSVGAPLLAAAYALAPAVEPLSYTYAHRTQLRGLGNSTYSLETGLGVPNGVAAL